MDTTPLFVTNSTWPWMAPDATTLYNKLCMALNGPLPGGYKRRYLSVTPFAYKKGTPYTLFSKLYLYLTTLLKFSFERSIFVEAENWLERRRVLLEHPQLRFRLSLQVPTAAVILSTPASPASVEFCTNTRSDWFHIDLLTTSIHTLPYPKHPVYILMSYLSMNQNMSLCA